VCNACPTGTYSTTMGATTSLACTNCTAGTYQNKTGQGSDTACQACDQVLSHSLQGFCSTYWLYAQGSTSGTLLGTKCTAILSFGRLEAMV
jgi:hypothetical protein